MEYRLRKVEASQSRSNGTEDILQNQWFGNSNRINSVNFKATTLKLAKKFDHPLSHLFIFVNHFVQGQGFDDVTVTSSKYFVFLH